MMRMGKYVIQLKQRGFTITHSETPKKRKWPSSTDSRNILSSRSVDLNPDIMYLCFFGNLSQFYNYKCMIIYCLLRVRIIDSTT
ncbi:hypothetical protein CISIN_1g034781mg [Citrus sinensis]|uniref:Uncharacterized protein n=1 Tax=Citrus sinensis TaxID=2711 RepID=A0A067E2D4_CITSI|nr:hypothetical protein CISIN_1g034781mg [Citrus sinensis]